MRKTKQLHLRTDKNFQEMVTIRAEQKGLTISDYIRNLVYADLKN